MSETESGILKIVPGPEVLDWLGPAGLLRVDGVTYHLPTMDIGELNALHVQLAQQADDIRAQLAVRDIEALMTGSLLAETLLWRASARHALALKKNQMAAIHADFSRRKTLLPPLSHYAFEAVFQLYGEVGMGRVMARARDLQDQDRSERTRRSNVGVNYGSKQAVCGEKIRYESQDEGVAAIGAQELTGKDVSGLTCYGPCPYCGKFHIGHQGQRRRKVRVAVDKLNRQKLN